MTATLRWADGRETRVAIDPHTTRVSYLGPDGRSHEFTETDELDADGCDIYVEEAESADGPAV